MRKRFSVLSSIERRRKLGKLFGAQPSGRQKRRSRHATRKPDQHDIAAPAHIRETAGVFVVIHVGSPLAGGKRGGLAHVNVVVSGHEADVFCGTQPLKPIATLSKFCGKSDIGDIAGDRNVVWLLRFDICDDRRELFRVVNETAFFLPVDIAGHTFADQLLPVRCRQRCEMRVGKMGEGEHRVCRGRPGQSAQWVAYQELVLRAARQ